MLTPESIVETSKRIEEAKSVLISQTYLDFIAGRDTQQTFNQRVEDLIKDRLTQEDVLAMAAWYMMSLLKEDIKLVAMLKAIAGDPTLMDSIRKKDGPKP